MCCCPFSVEFSMRVSEGVGVTVAPRCSPVVARHAACAGDKSTLLRQECAGEPGAGQCEPHRARGGLRPPHGLCCAPNRSWGAQGGDVMCVSPVVISLSLCV